MKKIGLQVNKKQAERMRKNLIEKNLLIKDLKISRDEEFVYFPVKNLPNDLTYNKSIRMEFEKIRKKPKSYKEIALIPKNLMKKLPTSYDIIGNIIVIKIPKDLTKYKDTIGEALLKVNKNIKTVCYTTSVSGELRTLNLEIISGEKSTITIHKEYDLKFFLDVAKTYYSPRLADERKRISNLVKPGETIVDMFTGVAPFSIMIARYANPKMIYAIDKNTDATKYALKNVKLNNVIDKIEIIHADSKNINKIIDKKKINVDRIIMNLPFSAHKFFSKALKLISKECEIHYYTIVDEKDITKRIKKLECIAEKNNILIIKCKIRKIKSYSPREFYIGIDITAKKKDADVA